MERKKGSPNGFPSGHASTGGSCPIQLNPFEAHLNISYWSGHHDKDKKVEVLARLALDLSKRKIHDKYKAKPYHLAPNS